MTTDNADHQHHDSNNKRSAGDDARAAAAAAAARDANDNNNNDDDEGAEAMLHGWSCVAEALVCKMACATVCDVEEPRARAALLLSHAQSLCACVPQWAASLTAACVQRQEQQQQQQHKVLLDTLQQTHALLMHCLRCSGHDVQGCASQHGDDGTSGSAVANARDGDVSSAQRDEVALPSARVHDGSGDSDALQCARQLLRCAHDLSRRVCAVTSTSSPASASCTRHVAQCNDVHDSAERGASNSSAAAVTATEEAATVVADASAAVVDDEACDTDDATSTRTTRATPAGTATQPSISPVPSSALLYERILPPSTAHTRVTASLLRVQEHVRRLREPSLGRLRSSLSRLQSTTPVRAATHRSMSTSSAAVYDAEVHTPRTPLYSTTAARLATPAAAVAAAASTARVDSDTAMTMAAATAHVTPQLAYTPAFMQYAPPASRDTVAHARPRLQQRPTASLYKNGCAATTAAAANAANADAADRNDSDVLPMSSASEATPLRASLLRVRRELQQLRQEARGSCYSVQRVQQ